MTIGRSNKSAFPMRPRTCLRLQMAFPSTMHGRRGIAPDARAVGFSSRISILGAGKKRAKKRRRCYIMARVLLKEVIPSRFSMSYIMMPRRGNFKGRGQLSCTYFMPIKSFRRT